MTDAAAASAAAAAALSASAASPSPALLAAPLCRSLVLDLGGDTIKTGWAGQRLPAKLIPNCAVRSKTTKSAHTDGKWIVGDLMQPEEVIVPAKPGSIGPGGAPAQPTKVMKAKIQDYSGLAVRRPQDRVRPTQHTGAADSAEASSRNDAAEMRLLPEPRSFSPAHFAHRIAASLLFSLPVLCVLLCLCPLFSLCARLVFRCARAQGFIVNWELENQILGRALHRSVLDPHNTLTSTLALGSNANLVELCSVLVTLPLLAPAKLAQDLDENFLEKWGAKRYRRINPGPLAQRGVMDEIYPSAAAAANATPASAAAAAAPSAASATAAAAAASKEPLHRLISLVVDSGYSFTHILPVYRGKVLTSASRRLGIGGKLLTNYLKELVSFRAWNMMDETWILNDVKEKCCYVSTDFEREIQAAKSVLSAQDTGRRGSNCSATNGRRTAPRDRGGRAKRARLTVAPPRARFMCSFSCPLSRSLFPRKSRKVAEKIRRDYVLPNGSTVLEGYVLGSAADSGRAVPGSASGAAGTASEDDQILSLLNERFAVPEVLFNPGDISMPSAGICELIAQSISACPGWMQPLLWENIVLVGGNARMPNMGVRIERELRSMAPQEYRIHVRQGIDPVLSTWLGGSALAAQADAIQSLQYVTKDELAEWGSEGLTRKWEGDDDGEAGVAGMED